MKDEGLTENCIFSYQYFNSGININGVISPKGLKYVRTLQEIAIEESKSIIPEIEGELQKSSIPDAEEPIIMNVIICIVLIASFLAKAIFRSISG